MSPIDRLPRFRRAAALGVVATLVACASVTVAPTPEGLDQARRDADRAVAAAERARDAAQFHAARGDWRSAARAVDRAMFSLRNARRLRDAVADAGERARARHQEAVAQRDAAHARLGRLRREFDLVPGEDRSRQVVDAGRGARCDAGCKKALTRTRTDTRTAERAVASTTVAVERSQALLARLETQVARVEAVAHEAANARHARGAPAGRGAAAPAATPSEPTIALPPETGFDQEVFGAQQ